MPPGETINFSLLLYKFMFVLQQQSDYAPAIAKVDEPK
jgi:hypothetical protein